MTTIKTLIGFLSVILMVSLYFNFQYITANGTTLRSKLFVSNKTVVNDIEASNETNKKNVINLHNSLSTNEFKKFSQNKEDGVIEYLLNYLGMLYKPGYFVEFGCEDGTQINTRYIRQKYKWQGLLMSGFNENPTINLHKELITHENILGLFEKYKVPVEIDLLSVDTDYADYWILEKILSKYTPKVVVHEVNQQTACVTVTKPETLFVWEGHDEYCGASVCAYYCLGKRFGYTLVYCESSGVNCFMVRDDLLRAALNTSPEFVHKVLTPSFLYRKLSFRYGLTNKSWHHVDC